MSLRLEVSGLGGFYDGCLHDAAFVSVYRGHWNTDGCTWVGGYYIIFRITHCRRGSQRDSKLLKFFFLSPHV